MLIEYSYSSHLNTERVLKILEYNLYVYNAIDILKFNFDNHMLYSTLVSTFKNGS